MPKLLVLFALAALSACALSGCGPGSTPAPRRAWTEEDPWYTGPPAEDPPYWTWTELDRTRIHEVVESKQPDAERRLQDVSIIELSDQEAAEFIGRALEEVPRTRPYLTRGL